MRFVRVKRVPIVFENLIKTMITTAASGFALFLLDTNMYTRILLHTIIINDK